MASELNERLIRRFRWVDPDPASEHLVSDVSGWWRDAEILARIGPALADPFRDARPTVVVAPEVTGVLLGPLVAVALGVGFLPAHKGTDDPVGRGTGGFREGTGGRVIAEPTSWARTGPDHRGRSLVLGVRDRHLGPGDRVLVVDDWVSTGAQVRALRQVIVARGAVPIGTAAVVADCAPSVAHELRLHALLTAPDIDP